MKYDIKKDLKKVIKRFVQKDIEDIIKKCKSNSKKLYIINKNEKIIESIKR
jgi:hypothetical protein